MLLEGESLALTSSVYLSDDNWSSYQLCSTTQHVVYAFGSNYAFKKYKRNKACRYQATLCIKYMYYCIVPSYVLKVICSRKGIFQAWVFPTLKSCSHLFGICIEKTHPVSIRTKARNYLRD